MIRVLVLAVLIVLGLTGCGAGASSADAGADGGAADAGPACPSTCASGCCDERGICFGTMRSFQPLSDTQCMPPDPFGPLRRCVSCEGGQFCAVLPREVSLYGCVAPRSCPACAAGGCCNNRTGQCETAAADDAGVCLR